MEISERRLLDPDGEDGLIVTKKIVERTMEKKVELEVKALSAGIGRTHAYALVLGETDGTRRLTLAVGRTEAQAIALELKQVRPPRPLAYDTFADTCRAAGLVLEEVLIYGAVRGVFFAYLVWNNYGERLRIDARTSDAVALALRLKAPIRIDEVLLEAEQANDPQTVALPVTLLDQDALQAALDKAVGEENYELADQLNQELRRRRESGVNPDDSVMTL